MPGRLALVTGASAGIGERFARALAARGHDLALVARRADRLEALSSELRGLGVAADAITADLCDVRARERVLAVLAERGREVQILVNNAGFGAWGPFASQQLERQLDQLRLHDEAAVALAHGVVGAMVARGEGAIVNVASSAGLTPVPHLAVYSGSKAFLIAFSEALGEELRPHGVAVLSVSPGAVPTEFGAVSGIDVEREPGPALPPERVVDETLRALGRGRRAVVPGWQVRAGVRAARLAPARLRLALLERAYRPDAPPAPVREPAS